MDVSAVDYELPASAIAQVPLEPRDAARLLIDEGPRRAPRHGRISDLPTLVREGDVVVLNTTRVLPARLRLLKPTGGAVEILLLEPSALDHLDWTALVRPSRRVAPGSIFVCGEDLTVVVGADLGEGRREVHLELDPALDPLALLARHGEVPLPPYITTPLQDPERYQTTYAREPSSVAAPTAGLHLTPSVIAQMEAAGAVVAPLELAVGLGTFRPIATEKIEDHRMHRERYRVPASTMARCQEAERVVAIGTTVVRALESVQVTGELEGRTELFLHGDARFAVVDALVTNFHQPRSSLLALVGAFIGPRWRELYGEALHEGYRFLSFGDAMFLRGARG
ncbi:MAG: tRNA preQ1(34) S-adenosylmethionine ribosyltransferase-isomerase QueA [Microthrixaceae bacterium]